MKVGRRNLYSLIVALIALSSPAAIPAHAQEAAPQAFVSFDNGGGGCTEGNYHTGSFPGG